MTLITKLPEQSLWKGHTLHLPPAATTALINTSHAVVHLAEIVSEVQHDIVSEEKRVLLGELHRNVLVRNDELIDTLPHARADSSPQDPVGIMRARAIVASHTKKIGDIVTTSTAPSSGLATPPIAVHIRWMIRRDMPEVLEIENSCFERPWSEEEFVSFLRQRNSIGMVAECGERVFGYMIYELHRKYYYLINLAVHPASHRLSVGAQLIGRLMSKLNFENCERRQELCCNIPETCIEAQLLFRCLGIRGSVRQLNVPIRNTETDRIHTGDDCDRYGFSCHVQLADSVTPRIIDNVLTTQRLIQAA